MTIIFYCSNEAFVKLGDSLVLICPPESFSNAVAIVNIPVPSTYRGGEQEYQKCYCNDYDCIEH